jgi:hypothetical protein
MATNAQKIEILKALKKVVKSYKDRRIIKGMCYAMNNIDNPKELCLSDLGIHRPLKNNIDKDGLISAYWFKTTKAGDKKRIALIDKAIKVLKKSK